MVTFTARLRSSVTSNEICTRRFLYLCKLDLNLRNKLVKCYIWSTALYGAETWTLGKIEMWCWRRMEKITWTDRVGNEEVLHRVKAERNILHEIKRTTN